MTGPAGSDPGRPVVEDVPTLVIGAGGLLGSAIVPRLAVPIAARGVAWSEPERAAAGLEDAVRDLARVTREGAAILWVAGRTVIASSADEVAAETRTFERFLSTIERHLDPERVRVLLASSAGALYAGSTGAPFDEHSEPVPRSDYGWGKLEQEHLLLGWARRTGGRAIVARVATVYGTGQDPAKRQGLVTVLCRSILTREPVRIFVPLDTRRHLVWEDDAAAAIIEHAREAVVPPGGSVVRIVASPESATVAEVVSAVGRVARRHPLVLRAVGRESARHGVDLRLRSNHATVATYATPLVVGAGRVWRALLRSL